MLADHTNCNFVSFTNLPGGLDEHCEGFSQVALLRLPTRKFLGVLHLYLNFFSESFSRFL